MKDFDIKKVLLKQAELLEEYNKKHSEEANEIRENTLTIMQIHSFLSGLEE